MAVESLKDHARLPRGGLGELARWRWWGVLDVAFSSVLDVLTDLL
jgi:hypothetical protein